jgi:hypothetical protein
MHYNYTATCALCATSYNYARRPVKLVSNVEINRAWKNQIKSHWEVREIPKLNDNNNAQRLDISCKTAISFLLLSTFSHFYDTNLPKLNLRTVLSAQLQTVFLTTSLTVLLRVIWPLLLTVLPIVLQTVASFHIIAK